MTPPENRYLLTHEDARGVAQAIMDRTSGFFNITIEHVVRSVNKVSTNTMLGAEDGSLVRLGWNSTLGTGIGVNINTDQLHGAALSRVLDRAVAMESPPTPPEALPPGTELDPAKDPDDPLHYTYNKREYLPVDLWRDSTAQAMTTARGEVLPRLLTGLKTAGMQGAATIGFTTRSIFVFMRLGREAYCRETDCEVTVTARCPDETGSGWSGQASRDWTQIQPDVVLAQAIDLGKRSQHMVALEPGRRTAILGPAAVAQLVREMANCFGASQADNGYSPFSLVPPRGKQMNKLGMRVFDPRLTMISDPADTWGGFPPFFEEDDDAGFPTPAVTWVDHGVLKNLAYDVSYAMKHGKTPMRNPDSIRIIPVPGTQTATIAEMIANCKEGVYVNRFNDVMMTDFRSGLMSGVSRDGCFFIKNGKIEKPVKNFRFLDSPFFAFNKLEMIGVPERVAFGYTTPARRGRDRWPRLPIIVPPIMVQDFNFSAMSDAV